MPAGQAHRKEAPLRDQARAPRKYELMTILHPDIAEESLPGELDRISGFITAAGGELFETLQDSPWGRRRLAYPIRSGGRDVRDGYYTVWRFTLGPTRVDDLERELKLDTQLIRYIVLSWEPPRRMPRPRLRQQLLNPKRATPRSPSNLRQLRKRGQRCWKRPRPRSTRRCGWRRTRFAPTS